MLDESDLTDEMKAVLKALNDYVFSEEEIEYCHQKEKQARELEECINKNREDGIKEGIKLGMKEGSTTMQHSIIKALLDTKHSDEDIIKITKCSQKVLKLIKKAK